ncbi:hypothetical protein LCGC14_1541530 [marine sediment metagenome]|uniref:dUTPase-like domain-containing protein n=1 Tax=marine sediment metagenome TaxID=412755 RepID=A0A0F9LTP0_9ZZZZ
MLLTGDEIISAHQAGEIVIDPFVPQNVNSASYDVSLGPFCYRQVPASVRYNRRLPSRMDYGYNPYDAKCIQASWQLDRAISASTLPKMEGVDDNDFVIPIGPKEIILAHTLEFIGSTMLPGGCSITTQMHSRSSSVRNCIDVCGSGGLGDHGYHSIWTLEVQNLSVHYTTYLVVGRRYAQISFYRTETTSRDYAAHGKYQAAADLERLRASWRPTMMLPRTHLDREVGSSDQHQQLIQELIQLHPIER